MTLKYIPQKDNQQPERLMRMPEAEQTVGLKRSTIYRLLATGNFPPQIKLSSRAIGFSSTQVQQWITDRMNAVL